jgi:hypothetical protein
MKLARPTLPSSYPYRYYEYFILRFVTVTISYSRDLKNINKLFIDFLPGVDGSKIMPFFSPETAPPQLSEQNCPQSVS